MHEPRPLRLSSSVGQTAAEYLGVLVVIAAIIAAISTTKFGDTIADGIQCKVQEIAGNGGACAAQEAENNEIDPECVTSTTTNSANLAVSVAFVEVGKGNVVIKETYADGTTKFTLLDKGTAAAKVLAGGKAKFGKFGGDWSAEASAGVDLAGAQVYEFSKDQKKEAEQFGKDVQDEGTFKNVVADVANGPGGIPGDVLKYAPLPGNPYFDPFGLRKKGLGLIGLGNDKPKLPKPTSTYVEGGMFADAEATGALGIGALDAEISGSLAAAANVKVTTAGKDKGQVEATYKLDTEAGGQLSTNLYGVADGGIGGKAGTGQEAKVTFGKRPDGSYGPLKMELKLSAQAAGNASLEQGLDAKDLDSAGKYLKDISLGTEENTGKKIESVIEVDLSNDELASSALDLVNGGDNAGAAAGDLWDAAKDNSKVTVSTFDTSGSETSGELAGGAGINGGISGDQSSATETLDESYVAKPGEGFRERNCGQN